MARKPKKNDAPAVEPIVTAAAALVIAAPEPTPPQDQDQKLTVTQRCQDAKETSCSCRCRGKYHGKEHPKDWKLEEGCEPLSPEERKIAKREALNQWRRSHPDRVAAYMKQWRETSDSPTAVGMRNTKKRVPKDGEVTAEETVDA